MCVCVCVRHWECGVLCVCASPPRPLSHSLYQPLSLSATSPCATHWTCNDGRRWGHITPHSRLFHWQSMGARRSHYSVSTATDLTGQEKVLVVKNHTMVPGGISVFSGTQLPLSSHCTLSLSFIVNCELLLCALLGSVHRSTFLRKIQAAPKMLHLQQKQMVIQGAAYHQSDCYLLPTAAAVSSVSSVSHAVITLPLPSHSVNNFSQSCYKCYFIPNEIKMTSEISVKNSILPQ